ncbi:hypothetical protein SELMODRAFT_423360 [Selaginella moellendorffii]|uniref:Uncharacterized protein n=1 Tax=Selaginella moellendorffii TaxID=88036 RepID=D8SLF5_SELML|nr:hypothetical protein SELMODRAFT_423360 [Selaginella moellendorffii]
MLVVEGILILEAEYNQVFGETHKSVPHPEDVDVILNSLESGEAKDSFSRFAQALYKGSRDDRLKPAIARTGARLFWAVARTVAAKYPDNVWLQNMLASDEARLEMIKAWSHVFSWRTHINVSHSFIVIGTDLEMANPLEVLRYVAQKCEESKVAHRRELGRLLQASLPFVEASVARHKEEVCRREKEEESQAEMMKCLLLPPIAHL